VQVRHSVGAYFGPAVCVHPSLACHHQLPARCTAYYLVMCLLHQVRVRSAAAQAAGKKLCPQGAASQKRLHRQWSTPYVTGSSTPKGETNTGAESSQAAARAKTQTQNPGQRPNKSLLSSTLPRLILETKKTDETFSRKQSGLAGAQPPSGLVVKERTR